MDDDPEPLLIGLMVTGILVALAVYGGIWMVRLDLW